jgi:hypothetical protein
MQLQRNRLGVYERVESSRQCNCSCPSCSSCVARPIKVLQMPHLQGAHAGKEASRVGLLSPRVRQGVGVGGAAAWLLRERHLSHGAWSIFMREKFPTQSSISNTGLIDGVLPSNANGLYNNCGLLWLLQPNGSKNLVIHDDIDMTFSDFVIDSPCWIWSPIWSSSTMTLCQFRHRFHHISHCIHDNSQISS